MSELEGAVGAGAASVGERPTEAASERSTEGAGELARRSARRMWSADAASRSMGMELVEVAPGRAVVAMTVTEDMINGWSVCHGGLIATLADSAFAVACNSRGGVTVAAGFDIQLVEPARLGDRLVATAREVLLRGRSGIYDVTVSREDDVAPVTVAEFRGRSRTVSEVDPPSVRG